MSENGEPRRPWDDLEIDESDKENWAAAVQERRPITFAADELDTLMAALYDLAAATNRQNWAMAHLGGNRMNEFIDEWTHAVEKTNNAKTKLDTLLISMLKII
jgi:hypothetical protein